MACSFGEIDGEPNIKPVDLNPAEQPGTTPTTDGTTPDDVTAAPGGGNQPSQPVGGNGPAAGFDPDEDPFQTVLGKEVKAILETNCGQCHQGTASGGMDYILNLKELITNGKVVPGNKEDSQLFVRMQQQSMPPAFIRDQRPTYGQIEQVGLFIDELPEDVLGTAPADCNALPFFNQDDQIAAMAQDIQNVDSADQPFTRYLTITYETNAGACERAVQRQRYALFKGINSVSTEAQIGIPKPIDSNETIYRIDIRDYNWANRNIW
jgi:serine/threonine-protein kinase